MVSGDRQTICKQGRSAHILGKPHLLPELFASERAGSDALAGAATVDLVRFNFNGSTLEAGEIRHKSLSLPGAGPKKPKLKLGDLLFGARERCWLGLTAHSPEPQAVGYRPAPYSFNYHKRLAGAIQVHCS